MIARVLADGSFWTRKSHFFFGPRQTGKSTLLKSLFPRAPYYNLLHSDVFFKLHSRPAILREEVRALKDREQPVIIDEVQKLPGLLDEVQALIDEGAGPFILTGSSARKLKAGGANLLGGRARVRHLFPFVSKELPGLDLERSLRYGLLPPVHLSDSPEEDLAAYCGTYLKEEIQAEALVRRLEGFSRFLRIAALGNGQELNYEGIARDCAVPARTVREYVAILVDTLVAECLEPWRGGRSRKPVSRAKLYFFDLGVARALAGRPAPARDSAEWGMALEQFVFQELRAWLSYSRDGRDLRYWRTVDGREADFAIGDDIAIEVKATANPSARDLKCLVEIAEEATWRERILVCQVERPRITDGGILILPVMEFLSRLWDGAWKA